MLIRIFTFIFILQSVFLTTPVYAAIVPVNQMPVMQTASLRGLNVLPSQGLAMQFLFEQNTQPINRQNLDKVVRMFMAGLTLEPSNIWVNLSPYEPERLMAPLLAVTELGQGLVEQDYLLKQRASLLTHPDTDLGKKFWQQALAVSSANKVAITPKVWIVPDVAVVYHLGQRAMLGKMHLKVMVERDYLALQKNQGQKALISNVEEDHSTALMRQMICPVLEREVNESPDFAQLREMYQALVLAQWFKKYHGKNMASLGYIGQSKIKGIDVNDDQSVKDVYRQYVHFYKKGAYNFVREDSEIGVIASSPKGDAAIVARKYFSGGLTYDPAMVQFIDASMVTDRSFIERIFGQMRWIGATVVFAALLSSGNLQAAETMKGGQALMALNKPKIQQVQQQDVIQKKFKSVDTTKGAQRLTQKFGERKAILKTPIVTTSQPMTTKIKSSSESSMEIPKGGILPPDPVVVGVDIQPEQVTVINQVIQESTALVKVQKGNDLPSQLIAEAKPRELPSTEIAKEGTLLQQRVVTSPPLLSLESFTNQIIRLTNIGNNVINDKVTNVFHGFKQVPLNPGRLIPLNLLGNKPPQMSFTYIPDQWEDLRKKDFLNQEDYIAILSDKRMFDYLKEYTAGLGIASNQSQWPVYVRYNYEDVIKIIKKKEHFNDNLTGVIFDPKIREFLDRFIGRSVSPVALTEKSIGAPPPKADENNALPIAKVEIIPKNPIVQENVPIIKSDLPYQDSPVVLEKITNSPKDVIQTQVQPESADKSFELLPVYQNAWSISPWAMVDITGVKTSQRQMLDVELNFGGRIKQNSDDGISFKPISFFAGGMLPINLIDQMKVMPEDEEMMDQPSSVTRIEPSPIIIAGISYHLPANRLSLTDINIGLQGKNFFVSSLWNPFIYQINDRQGFRFSPSGELWLIDGDKGYQPGVHLSLSAEFDLRERMIFSINPSMFLSSTDQRWAISSAIIYQGDQYDYRLRAERSFHFQDSDLARRVYSMHDYSQWKAGVEIAAKRSSYAWLNGGTVGFYIIEDMGKLGGELRLSKSFGGRSHAQGGHQILFPSELINRGGSPNITFAPVLPHLDTDPLAKPHRAIDRPMSRYQYQLALIDFKVIVEAYKSEIESYIGTDFMVRSWPFLLNKLKDPDLNQWNQGETAKELMQLIPILSQIIHRDAPNILKTTDALTFPQLLSKASDFRVWMVQAGGAKPRILKIFEAPTRPLPPVLTSNDIQLAASPVITTNSIEVEARPKAVPIVSPENQDLRLVYIGQIRLLIGKLLDEVSFEKERINQIERIKALYPWATREIEAIKIQFELNEMYYKSEYAKKTKDSSTALGQWFIKEETSRLAKKVERYRLINDQWKGYIDKINAELLSGSQKSNLICGVGDIPPTLNDTLGPEYSRFVYFVSEWINDDERRKEIFDQSIWDLMNSKDQIYVDNIRKSLEMFKKGKAEVFNSVLVIAVKMYIREHLSQFPNEQGYFTKKLLIFWEKEMISQIEEFIKNRKPLRESHKAFLKFIENSLGEVKFESGQSNQGGIDFSNLPQLISWNETASQTSKIDILNNIIGMTFQVKEIAPVMSITEWVSR